MESDADSAEQLDSPSDSGSDFEAQLRPKKRRSRAVAPEAPPSKRPLQMSTVHSPHVSHSSNGMLVAGHLDQVCVQEGSPATAGDLYEALRSGRSAMVTVVDEWLESYKQDKEAGLLELMNFVVQCCGCKGFVTKEMFDSMENVEIISRLTKDFNEDCSGYPLSSTGPQWRRFRTCLCEFLQLLVRRCQNSLLYDDYLFSSLLALLTGLSDSQVRAFRHTSTLMAMKLMTALVEVAMDVSTQVETTQRRYKAEMCKEVELRAQERLEKLHTSYTQLQDQQEELQSMMNTVFKGIFVHRYRDLVPEIRVICMEEIGVWLQKNPSVFLNDGYLKYLGWTLHDKQGVVRQQCVRSLKALYREKDFAGRLELFTSRFKERMLSMIQDKVNDVAQEAIQLLLLIHQNTEEGLSEEECERVYPLVFASHRGSACAAGNFLYHRLCSELDKENQENEKRKAAFLLLLVSFFIQTEFHEHAMYLVDSLWDCAGKELRDWETMTSMLLQEKGQNWGLKDEEEGALIEVMICAVRQAAESHPPVSRAPAKRVLRVKDQKAQEQQRNRLTNHFIIVLPQLMAKYSADAEKVTSLLKAPLHFNLETYSSNSRLEKYLDLLLVQLCGIVEKHQDDEVLRACALVACALCAERYSFSARAEMSISQLLDRLVDQFTSGLTDVLQGGADEDELYSVAIAMKRIAAFSSAKDLTGREMLQPCLQILKYGLESREISSMVMVPALKCACFHLFWEKVKITSSVPSKPALKQLRQNVHSLYAVCQSCLSVGEVELRDQAFLLLCDLLLVYSSSLVQGNTALQTLACPPSVSLRAEMSSFLLDYVFTEPENDPQDDDEEGEFAKIAVLQRCRNQLAGYCKLVIYGVLDLSAASDVFKHYSKFYKDYGDIMKETLSKSKIVSPILSAKTVCLSLQQLYSQLPWEQGEERVRFSQEFREMRELARHLAMTFGVNLHRVRKPLVALHKDGIQFAFQGAKDADKIPHNLLFLETLSEFSFKLLHQDRKQLLGFLKRLAPTPLPAWPSLRLYRHSLEMGRRASEKGHTPSHPTQSILTSKRPRTSSKTGTDMSIDSSVPRKKDSQWLESSSIASLATPPLTSTTLKGALPQTSVPRVDRAGSLAASDEEGASEPESLKDFMERQPASRTSLQRRQRPVFLAPSTPSTQSDLGSHLSLLTLIEEDEEPEMDNFQSGDSDSDTPITLPSTRHSTSLLEELFS
ncbi:cohesin subunit SA-1 isoform X2 [Scleropages formosus]|uniref:Cohesin subunit SA n=1 Tax=Scleropages formosus TaxID=113540 RepID=A0A8C9QQ42_SCLFO|nr:cohesin subunit SA-1-like isoform X2 [Scleropages formosus]